MMSLAKTTGVGKGVVSIFQSVGAVGLGVGGMAATGGAGMWAGARISRALLAKFAGRKNGERGPDGKGGPDAKGRPDGKGGPDAKGRPDGKGEPDGKSGPDRKGG